jgi:Protein of unknown function (DUF760)
VGDGGVLLDGASGGNRLYEALRELSSGPDDMQRMKVDTSEAADDAFQRTVLGIVGALPSDAYEVTITSDRGGLSRLMHSSLCTGYALRNAEFRLALNDALSDALAPGCGRAKTAAVIPDKAKLSPKRGRPSKKAAADGGGGGGGGGGGEPDYMWKVPARGGPYKVDSSRVEGSVRWWDADAERRREMGGAEYVARLESENALLRDRLSASAAHADHTGNRILDFMKTLSVDKIAALQHEISPLSEDTFRRVLVSVLGEINANKVQTTYSTSRDYLAQITWWCLLVGYTVRNLEKKRELASAFADAESLDPSIPSSSTSSSPSSSSSSSSHSSSSSPASPPSSQESPHDQAPPPTSG